MRLTLLVSVELIATVNALKLSLQKLYYNALTWWHDEEDLAEISWGVSGVTNVIVNAMFCLIGTVSLKEKNINGAVEYHEQKFSCC